MNEDDQELSALLRAQPHEADGAERRAGNIQRAARRQVAARDVGDFFLERIWRAIWDLLRPMFKSRPSSRGEHHES